jgi:hypothetical protein
MTTADYALIISGFALVTSIGAFIWNVWQKFIFVRPALQVFFGIFDRLKMNPDGETAKPSGHRVLVLTVTNMGPGPATLYTCVGKEKRHWWARPKVGTINPIDNHPLSENPISKGPFSAGLPAKIDAGDMRTFYFPFTNECFLREGLDRVGIADTFGRNTWCRRRNMRKAYSEYLETFGPSKNS